MSALLALTSCNSDILGPTGADASALDAGPPLARSDAGEETETAPSSAEETPSSDDVTSMVPSATETETGAGATAGEGGASGAGGASETTGSAETGGVDAGRAGAGAAGTGVTSGGDAGQETTTTTSFAGSATSESSSSSAGDAGLPNVLDSGVDAGLDAGPLLPPIAQAVMDVADLATESGFFRAFGGPAGDGTLGVPVAAGGDLDGDGLNDVAFAAFQATSLGRLGAGQIYVIFGTGPFEGSLDIAANPANVLTVYGAGVREGAGSELAIADVNDDGLADLLVARQNYRASNPDRIGAGALSIILGGAGLRAALQAGNGLDLAAPPADVEVITLVGRLELDRLGIWVRTGDITGDGIEDIAVGADQEDEGVEIDRGAVYVVRGGAHLDQSQLVDLAQLGSSTLDGHVARVLPPPNSNNFHFGATVTIGDLDRNGRAELVGAAALVRSGATYPADGAPAGSAVGSAGAPGGRVYIVWDDNFPSDVWSAGYTVQLGASPGALTELHSDSREGIVNRRLGEELIAGGDYDSDGRPDLFVGDMTATAAGGRSSSGVGFVVFDAAELRAEAQVTLLLPPATLRITRILGATAGAICSDTARSGDFDGDGITDLAIASPNASPEARIQAGTVHVLWGNPQQWPGTIDLAALPSADLVQITELRGARGGNGSDSGDMLAYSAEVFDLNGDGLSDLIANEMGGNGLAAGTIDTGNLLVIDGLRLSSSRPDCSGRLLGLASVDACGVCVQPGGETECVRFVSDVLPILQAECPSCHGSSGGLSLFSYEQLMAGTSDNGPVVLPGDAEGSAIIQKLRGTAPFGEPMPPGTALPTAQIDLLAAWITAGARDN